MRIETRLLRSEDDAKRILDLVYTAYGLTYHRSFMYEPKRLLELNRQAKIRSIIGIHPETGGVIAHMATIRPWFETVPPDRASLPPTAVELGLSIVHPEHRGKGQQSAIGLACLMQERLANPRLASLFGKCLTAHTHSQRAGRFMLGRASALLLGSVPAWVVHDSGRRPNPMTTILLHSPCVTDPRPLHVPARHADLVRALLVDSTLGRTVASVEPGATSLRGASTITRWFEPERRRGVIQVWEAGEQVAAEVLELTRWMVGGHMEHVTVLLPATPGTCSLLPELEEAGLFFGGFVPDLDGRDVLVLEWLEHDVMNVDSIQVMGEEAKSLKAAVVRNWQESRRERREERSASA